MTNRRKFLLRILAGAAGGVAGGWALLSFTNFRLFGTGKRRIDRISGDNAPLKRLCLAIRDDNLDELDRLVTVEKIPVDTAGKWGNTAAEYAISLRNVAAFERLLELGLNPDKIRYQDGDTFHTFEGYVTLLEEIFCPHLSVMERSTRNRLLETALKYGADPNLVNPGSGRTAVFLADDAESLAILLRFGADLNHYDQYGNTPLIALVPCNETGHVESFEMTMRLLEAGADYRRMDRHGLTITDYLSVLSSRTFHDNKPLPPEKMLLVQRALDFLKVKPDGLPFDQVSGAPNWQTRQHFILRRQQEFGLIPAPEKELERKL